MTEQRHRTVLEIAVDDQGVKNLAGSIERAFEPDTVRAFTDAVDRSARAMAQLEEAIGGLGNRKGGGGGGGQPPRTPAQQEEYDKKKADKKAAADAARADARERREDERDNEQRSREARALIGRVWDRAMGLVGSAAAGSFTGGLMGALPLVGPAASGALAGVQGFYQDYTQAQGALAKQFGQSGITNPNPDDFTQWGMGPQEAAGAVGQMAQRSGRSGESLREIIRPQLQLQNLLGVQNGANIVGAQESRGGQAGNAQRLMMDAVSTGLEAGIRTAKLDQYLGNISSWVEQVRTQGIDFSADSALALSRGFSVMGKSFTGEAGLKRAQGVADALSRAADQSGIGTGLAFEAARRVAGSNASIEDLIDLQEKRDERFVQTFLGLARNVMGGDILGIRGLLKSAGVDMTIEQLRDVKNGSLEGFTRAAGNSAQVLAAERQAKYEGVAGPGRERAVHDVARADLGGQKDVQKAARDVMHADLELAKVVLPLLAPIIASIADTVPTLLRGNVKEVARTGLNSAGEMLGIPKLGDDWKEGLKDGPLQALREFFQFPTFLEVMKAVASAMVFGNPFNDGKFEQQIRDAAKNQPPPIERHIVKPPPEEGPHSSLQKGAVPALREARDALGRAATEIERMQMTQDGALGFG